MPTTPERANHLNTAQLSRLKKRLEAERAEFKAKIGAAKGSGVEAQVEDPLLREPEDFGELGKDITIEETELAIAANEHRILDHIERALERMKDGTYGLSEITGKPIPYERLEALPWATTNVED